MISTKKLTDYLKKYADAKCTLTAPQFENFAIELFKVGHREEMESGEVYRSIEDFDIPELIDSSDGGSIIREYGLNWLGLADSEDDDSLDDDVSDSYLDAYNYEPV